MSNEKEYWFHLYYHCPQCDTTWEDEWSSIVNDECPNCKTRDIEPYKYEDFEVML